MTVKVRRSANPGEPEGKVEDGWVVWALNGENVVVMKKDDPEKGSRKKIKLNELKELNGGYIPEPFLK